jgi:hypothetical protein
MYLVYIYIYIYIYDETAYFVIEYDTSNDKHTIKFYHNSNQIIVFEIIKKVR